MLIIPICTPSIDTHMHWRSQRAAPRLTALMWQQTASSDPLTRGPSMLPPTPPKSFIYWTFEDFFFNCAASAPHETSAVCRIISLSPHLTSDKSLNISFPSCIQMSINITKEPPHMCPQASRNDEKWVFLPLKPEKFPHSSRDALKEGRDALKKDSLPLEGFRMVSVNRFICRRVLRR